MIVAIDGHSSCGKSTLSKALAQQLGFIYIDTGAMYRAVTLYFLDHNIDYTDAEQVACAIDDIDITFNNEEGANICYLNGVNVEDEIRSMRVSAQVSEVAAIAAVRESCVAMQRIMSRGKDIVMDGRDIGTVVFPHADVKLFITADQEIRAQRRYEELLAKGKEVSLSEVKANLLHRDTIDSNRAHSPLRKAADAIVIDNSNLTKEEQLALALSYINTKKDA